jgi:hypothetical protein
MANEENMKAKRVGESSKPKAWGLVGLNTITVVVAAPFATID